MSCCYAQAQSARVLPEGDDTEVNVYLESFIVISCSIITNAKRKLNDSDYFSQHTASGGII